jgi:hypothetical protein
MVVPHPPTPPTTQECVCLFVCEFVGPVFSPLQAIPKMG